MQIYISVILHLFSSFNLNILAICKIPQSSKSYWTLVWKQQRQSYASITLLVVLQSQSIQGSRVQLLEHCLTSIP